MMIAGGFALWLVFQTCGKNFHSWKENCRQIAAFQLMNLIKKNNIRAPPTPPEAALVGIAH